LNSQGPLHDERQNFCRRLRLTRERNGITLAQIADATKIRMSLFAGLERNELRGWPLGLYRRAYFREYIRIVDDDMADDWCADFKQLFTDEPVPDAAKPSNGKSPLVQPDDLRLAFDTTWHGPKTSISARLLIAVLDAGVTVAAGWLVASLWALDARMAVAIAAVTYFSLATVLVGETPVKWIVSRRDAIADAFRAGIGKRDEAAVESASDEAEPADGQTWVTDARRVAQPASPLRVRFKA
jgi:hypothetical protein